MLDRTSRRCRNRGRSGGSVIVDNRFERSPGQMAVRLAEQTSPLSTARIALVCSARPRRFGDPVWDLARTRPIRPSRRSRRGEYIGAPAPRSAASCHTARSGQRDERHTVDGSSELSMLATSVDERSPRQCQCPRESTPCHHARRSSLVTRLSTIPPAAASKHRSTPT